MKKSAALFTLLVILALGAFFRFYALSETPPGLYPDEAMNGNNALEALAGAKNFDISIFRNSKVFYPENNGREGLFINIQALSLAAFGNEPWALRLVSAIIGFLTIISLFLLAKELFFRKGSAAATLIALLAAFFVASSFWHINFSRIGFRAIMVPLLSTLALYFLLRAFRTGNMWHMVWAGIAAGLGFHTYIAFRVMPLVLAIPIIYYLWQWWRAKNQNYGCAPCAVALFILVTFVAALPVGWYFLNNPEDFAGRTTQVSVFAAERPLAEFGKSLGLTLQMFFWQGDCNWRHNYNCQPELHPIVAVFFLTGFVWMVREVFRRTASCKLQAASLMVWFFAMSLPAALTREGLPHALRAIGMIPPVMIMAGTGAWALLARILGWIELQKEKWPQHGAQLGRIKTELIALFIIILAVVPWAAWRDYFVRWAFNKNTYFAFATDMWHLGKYLDSLPDETVKYVVANLPATDARGVPVSAQTVMFATDTFREAERARRNFIYVKPEEAALIAPAADKKAVIAFLNGDDRELVRALRERFPDFRATAPGDFIVLEK